LLYSQTLRNEEKTSTNLTAKTESEVRKASINSAEEHSTDSTSQRSIELYPLVAGDSSTNTTTDALRQISDDDKTKRK